MAEYVGYTAAAVTCGTLLPQIAKSARTRSVDDVSYGMLLMSATANALWGTYGVLISNAPMVATGSISMVATAVLLAMKGLMR